ncbi:MAG: helicase [Planctomycetaceae bacterium]|nr:helicase [Planctomycetaceae bacterium]|tara:strand:+ start:3716 stop:7006 length:3291 start_codon:yes stop_codon:yes gene_type:complete
MSRPTLIDNRNGNTLSKELNAYLKNILSAETPPEELCIATGYFNAAGWLKVAEHAGKFSKLRLLIGAEPSPQHEALARRPGDPEEPALTHQRVEQQYISQVNALKRERDQVDFHPDGLGRLRELVQFFRSGKVEVRRFEKRFFHAKAWITSGKGGSAIAGSSNLTGAGMSRNIELNTGHYDPTTVTEIQTWYDDVWQEAVEFDLSALYEELFDEYTPWMIYLRVLWELYGDELELEQDEIGTLTLTRFQKHGVWRAKRILETLGGVIIADGVGLGKTFTAGGIMQPYRDRRQRILLIRPAALEGTWDKFLNRHYLEDVECISYQKLAGDQNFEGDEKYLKRPLDEYQLIVIDEAHNYRNPDAQHRAGVLRTFLRGAKRDLVLLTATPVNNSLYDLYHMVSFFLRQDSQLINYGIPSIKGLFDDANHYEPGDLHPDILYPLIDATTVKRTRQFIKRYYRDDRIPNEDGEQVPITFPKPIPLTVRYNLDDALPGFFAHFAEALMPETGTPRLTMARYQVERYLLNPEEESVNETALVGLLRSGLLKRFESSAHAFANTCRRMSEQHRLLLEAMDNGQVITKDFYRECGASEDLDDEEFHDLLSESSHTHNLGLYDAAALREDVANDLAILTEFAEEAEKVSNDADPKLDRLVEALAEIAAEAKQDGLTEREQANNRKVLIFSYYADTAKWIQQRLATAIDTDERLAVYKGRIATTCGSPDGTKILDSDQAAWGFAPKTAAPDSYQKGDLYDILIATDVLAEGVNLQQARHIINADLPWNPMRLIQRHGRIDRLLSEHKRVYLRTFFPDALLDSLLQLEERVRRKLALAAASVGVADTPIQEGASRDQSFSETRDEIEEIANETTDLFERGGTTTASQTGEEYRQELRKALEAGLGETLAELPWKAGSGMVKGKQTGHFFLAKVGEQTYLRFVPNDSTSHETVISQIGKCLRTIECSESTKRQLPENSMPRAYKAWELAKDSIWHDWDFYTDPKNLQPKVRKLNREVQTYLVDNPDSISQDRLDKADEILISPWPRREENRLREVWKRDFKDRKSKASALIDAIIETGIEPYEQPERYPKISREQIHLVCWMYIQAEDS